MKNLVLAVVFVTGLISCGNHRPEGRYSLRSIDGKPFKPSGSVAISFNDDSTCIVTEGDQLKKVYWQLNEDGKTLTLTNQDGKSMDWNDFKLEAESFTCTDRGHKMEFRRTE